MPWSHLITGLPFLKVEDVTGRSPIRVRCRIERAAVCPRCGSGELRLKDTKLRKIKGITHGNAPMELHIAVPKHRCKACGRTFMQEIAGVRPYSRTSQLEGTGFDLFKTLGKTLKSWGTEILRMFTVPYSNGPTEGFHRKMKLIQRRAYGCRNFENYRLRVIVLCGHLPQASL